MAQSGSAQTVDLPRRLPLVIEPSNRDESASKDAKLVNCYMESQKTPQGQEYWIYKRAGIATSSQPSGGAANGLGLYNWLGNIYSIFGNKMYKDGVAIAGTVDTTNGVYRFASCLGATPKLQLGNGVKAYNYDDSNGLVQITDGDFPTTFVKGWAYLDGTTYVMKANAHIQGDDINTPTDWDPLNDILAQIEPDAGVALAKQLVYVVALKQWSVEVFYDAGNAVGSPLGQVQGAKANIGCLSADSVQDVDGALFFVSTSRSSGVQIIMMESLKTEVISTKPVERLLDQIDYSTVFSWQLKHDGHSFYIVTFKASNLTLAFDIRERAWHQWKDASGNYFPIVRSTFNASLQHILQHETDGYLYLADQAYTSDNGSPIVCDIITPLFDAGVQGRGKQMGRMFFVGDQTPGSVFQVRKSDDDYQTWSNPRRVEMGRKSTPALDNCGTFTRRAHWIQHACATPMRLKAVELQLDLCTL